MRNWSKTTWAFIVSLLFGLAQQVTPLPEGWKVPVAFTTWSLAALAGGMWLRSHWNLNRRGVISLFAVLILGVMLAGLCLLRSCSRATPGLQIDLPPFKFDGSDLAGIKWQKTYIGLVVDLISPAAQLQDLDFQIQLDRGVSKNHVVVIDAIRQIGDFPDVVAFPSLPDGLGSGLVGMLIDDGKGKQAWSDSKPDSQVGSGVWRVHFNKLIQNARLRLVIAATRVPTEMGVKPDSGRITRVEIKGMYKYESGSGLQTQEFRKDLRWEPTRLSPTPNTAASPP